MMGDYSQILWASCILYFFSGLHLLLHTHIIVTGGGGALEYLNMMNNIKERKAPATTIIRWNWEKSLEMENYEFTFTQCIYWLLSTKLWYLQCITNANVSLVLSNWFLAHLKNQAQGSCFVPSVTVWCQILPKWVMVIFGYLRGVVYAFPSATLRNTYSI